ncbi:MAG: hypothetical protein H8E44_23695, partial [Planctomycetes bacterium]|nr:hypothetical protein [Planctomycetota bacterium]
MRELTELIDMIRDEQITVEQVARLEEILAEHEDARRYYRRAMRLHGYLEQNAASIQLANEAGQLARTPWGRPLAGPVKLARRRKWARWGAAAAALAVCLVLGAWLVRLAIWGGDQRQEDQAQRLVDPSEHPSIALSRAWKIKQTGNADFSIVEETVVRLDRGELWIASVDGESASTLRVQTPAGDVTASGTQFLVGFHHVPIQSEGEGPMKSLARVFVLSGIVTLTNAHGTATGGENELLATTGQSAPTKQVVQANSAFAIDMYRQLAKENAGKNLSFSPYSISIALTMTAEGARGTTAQEMGQVLCWPEAMRRAGSDAQTIPWATSTVHSGLSSLSQMLNRQQDTREKEKAPDALSIANALWGERTYPIDSLFVNT